jgi:alkaline phosphatase D
MRYRHIYGLALVIATLIAQVGLGQDQAVITRIAFGSCANQTKPCPIWEVMADYRPQLTLLLGDNVYADQLNGRMQPATPDRIVAAYQVLQQDAGFARLRQQSQLMATWDDHDYGANDAGGEWVHKAASAQALHDFLDVAPDAPIRQQAGVYQARVFGPVGKRVQVILLDTRFFRSALPQGDTPKPGFRARPYLPQTGPDAQLLGAEQWRWLEQQLREPAEVRLIGSSIQVLSDQHPFEMWANFPEERQRFYDLLRETEASGVVLLSGDRHLGEISLDPTAISYPLYDLTASGLNQGYQGWRLPEPNAKRFAALPFGNHFGSIEIDWESSDPVLSLQLRLEDGQIGVQAVVPLSVLVAEPRPLPRPAGALSPTEALALEVGQPVVVQMSVRAGRDLAAPRRILLNSQQNYSAESNLTLVVQSAALAGPHQEAKLETFLNQTVRATGKVTLYNGRKQVEVTRPEDLEIVPR